MTIVERLYSLLVLIVSPVLGLLFLFSKRGRIGICQRFGDWGRLQRHEYFWIHGASLGEIRGILPLIKSIKTARPDQAILVTATSPTAFEVLAGLNVEYRLLPFDQQMYFERALRRISVTTLVIAETEIWPGLLSFAARRKIAVVIVNARISNYTIARYKFLVKLIPHLFARLHAVLVADNASLERFRELGAKTVHLTGNMKYDTEPSLTSISEQHGWRTQFPFAELPILVLGSIRPGEEEIWLKAISQQRQAGADFGCVLAPRHMEKVEFFVEKLRTLGLSFWRFSERQRWPSEGRPDVVLLDSLGALEKTYAIASLVFIGASLVDIGGHNPLEAAAYGVPIVIGPYDSTVREITEQLTAVGGIVRITVGEDLELLIKRLVSRDLELVRIGLAGQEIWRCNRGATEKVLGFLQSDKNGGTVAAIETAIQ